MRKETRLQRIWMILAILMTLMIWFNSSLDANLSSQQSGWVTSIVGNLLHIVNIEVAASDLSFYVRKTAHFGQFFILGMLWFETFFSKRKQFKHAVKLTLPIGTLTAVLDETIQLFTPGRAFMVSDIFIDVFGLIMGVLVLITLHILWIKLIEKKQRNTPIT